MSEYWLGIDGEKWDQEDIQIPSGWPRSDEPLILWGARLDHPYLDEIALIPSDGRMGASVRLKVSGRVRAQQVAGPDQPILALNDEGLPTVDGLQLGRFIEKFRIEADPHAASLDVTLCARLPVGTPGDLIWQRPANLMQSA